MPTSKPWRELYDAIPPERRAKIEIQVMHDLAEMELIDQCDYTTATWRCIKKLHHLGGHSPFLEDGECQFRRKDADK